jgi:hypothetical protein
MVRLTAEGVAAEEQGEGEREKGGTLMLTDFNAD